MLFLSGARIKSFLLMSLCVVRCSWYLVFLLVVLLLLLVSNPPIKPLADIHAVRIMPIDFILIQFRDIYTCIKGYSQVWIYIYVMRV